MIAKARISLLTVLTVILLVAATGFLARRPYYNWDMFPYMALVMQERNVPFESTHRAVYETAWSRMPQSDYEAISARQPVLRDDSKAFEAVLPYFKLKPGYTLLARSLFLAGLNPLDATWLPSIAGYLGLCLILFFWAKSCSPEPAAALFTLIIASSPPMTDLARYSSPDMLCACVITGGIILAFRGRHQLAMALLIFAITIRPDAGLLVLPFALVLAVTKRLTVTQATGWVLAGMVVILFLFAGTGLVGQYLFLDLSLSQRFGAYANGLSTVWHSYFLPLSAIAFGVLYLRRKQETTDLQSLFVWASILAMLIRFLLHPFYEDRFNLAAYLVILIIGWKTVMGRLYPDRQISG